VLFYYDMVGLLIMLPVFLFAVYTQSNIRNTYNQYSRISNSRGMTGGDAARYILDKNGLYHVQVTMVRGELSDHYDPRTNTVALSQQVHNSASIAALGIAAHECGHAIQHEVNYAPLRLRSVIIPATNFASSMAIPLFFIGYFLNSNVLITVGIFSYVVVAFFQLVTLPVEFNASRRAMQTIESDRLLEGSEAKGAEKMLRAAAMTYVAALASALAQVLRLLVMSKSRRRD
jgi:Predicted Zn-dependent protease